MGGSHDLTEVRPGLLLAASNPVTYLDARKPLAPKVLARGPLPDDRSTHGMAWPRGGKDRFVLGSSESGYGCTRPEEGTFFVHDTRKANNAKVWTRTGDYTIAAGLAHRGQGADLRAVRPLVRRAPVVQGPPGGEGLVRLGVRFLEVTKKGAAEERGFWQPLPSQSSAVYWVSPDTVWVTDCTARGIDVLRFDSTKPAESDAHHRADGSLRALASRWVCKP